MKPGNTGITEIVEGKKMGDNFKPLLKRWMTLAECLKLRIAEFILSAFIMCI